MTDRATLMEKADDLTLKLGQLTTAIYGAGDDLTAAEEKWLPLYDAVAETMREEAGEAGRAAPAAHVVLSAARHRHPGEYGAFKRAKRELHRLELMSHNRRSELSGVQTQIKNAEESKPKDDRSGLPQHAQRQGPRAA